MVNKAICPKSAHHYRAALQFFSDNYEHAPPHKRIIVNSPAVTTALNRQLVSYQTKWLSMHISAHNHPLNNLSLKEEATIIKYGIQIVAWKDFCFAFKTCTQTMIRGDGI